MRLVAGGSWDPWQVGTAHAAALTAGPHGPRRRHTMACGAAIRLLSAEAVSPARPAPLDALLPRGFRGVPGACCRAAAEGRRPAPGPSLALAAHPIFISLSLLTLFASGCTIPLKSMQEKLVRACAWFPAQFPSRDEHVHGTAFVAVPHGIEVPFPA